MPSRNGGRARLAGGLVLVGVLLTAAGVRAQTPAPGAAAEPVFTVDGQVALHSLVTISDLHLQKLADALTLVAAMDGARAADWERIRGPLAEAARLNVPAVHWFALPNGDYWTIERGHAGNLSDRAYFPRVLSGKTVIGDLVVSRSSGSNTAIVAVPVRGPEGRVVGALGSSVRLDSLAERIRGEMGGLGAGVIFYAIDAEPLGALNSDPSLIFTEPMKLGGAEMRRAFREMLAGQEGVVTYEFRGARRTVLFQRSPVTGWWYGFGVAKPTTVRAGAR